MADGDVYRVTPVFSNGDIAKTLTTHVYVRQNGAVAPSISFVGDAVKSWWDTDLGGDAEKSRHSIPTSLDKVTLRRIDPLEPVIQEYDDGLPIVGTGSGDADNPQNAPIVSMRTANSGRSYRNRSYLPPLLEGTVSASGTITSLLAQDIADQWRGLLDALDTSLVVNCEPVVYSYALATAFDITTVLVDRRIRTQRRRQLRSTVYVSA